MTTTDPASTLAAVKPVLTASEYGRVDQAYEGDLIEAMDRAGHAVAQAAARCGAGYGERVVVLAGPGNNGGDGYVAARYLRSRGAAVEVQALAEPKTPEAIDAAAKARAAGVRIGPIRPPSSRVSPVVVVDALFGGGARPGLPDAVGSWMGTKSRVVSVDYPTGLDPDTGVAVDRSFRATETVTFSTLKTGHLRKDGPDRCGRVTVVDIGIDGGQPSMFIAEESDAPRPPRLRSAHKWSAGSVVVAGGSEGMLGACVFAGLSALNFGAGSVQVASPNAKAVHRLAPQLPTFDLDDVAGRLDRFDVAVVGPGVAETDARFLVPVLERASRVVLDAGGLRPDLLNVAVDTGARVVVTPHAGEFTRLTGNGPGAYTTRAFARDSNLCVLLKGGPTIVTEGGPPVLVNSGGPELASIGTGDVLAGMIAALWSRGLGGFDAAISAAYWHGLAASDLRRKRTVTAESLLSHISSFAW